MAVEKAVERKIVSILFADLVGFTSLSEQLDAEDVAAVQGAYFDTVRQVIGRYGGQLEKFIGDAAMAVFGVPVTRDDDAERAVRAGLALIERDRAARRPRRARARRARRARRRQHRRGRRTRSRPGRATRSVTGDPVNVAARLQSARLRGRCSSARRRRSRSRLRSSSGSRRAGAEGKGRAGPARGVTGIRPEPSRDAAMGALRAPLLGPGPGARTPPRRGRPSRRGPRRVLVVAPPGVGKTRLVDELAALAPGAAVAARGCARMCSRRSSPSRSCC